MIKERFFCPPRKRSGKKSAFIAQQLRKRGDNSMEYMNFF